MSDKLQLIAATSYRASSLNDRALLKDVLQILSDYGYCRLRKFCATKSDFDTLVSRLCSSTTFDPARTVGHGNAQMVNSGNDALGLHIENGDTPNVPELIGFYCANAPCDQSATTICDGVELLQRLPYSLQAKFSQPMCVTRTLPELVWKSYLANEHPLYSSASEVSNEDLVLWLELSPEHRGTIHVDGSLTLELQIDPLRTSRHGGRSAFANAIMGPSDNHDPATYTLGDGTVVDAELLSTLNVYAEPLTSEIHWQSGDVVLIDNWRVMHGRRAIEDAKRREVYVAMGNLA